MFSSVPVLLLLRRQRAKLLNCDAVREFVQSGKIVLIGLLVLYLYQLASLASLCPRPGCEMQGSSPLGVDAVEKGLEIGDEQ